jgi:hypothetical protein
MFKLVCCAWAMLAAGASPPLIELTTGGVSYQGRQVCHNKQECWLVDVDGRMHSVPLAGVTSFRQVAPVFQPRPLPEVKQSLLAELGAGFEVAIRGRCVVCAPRGKADEFAQLFDQTSREFLQYLRVRKFEIVEPDLPLVSIVLPTRSRFDEQCSLDNVPVNSSLRGYYNQRSNRVVLYDDPAADAAAAKTPGLTNAGRTGLKLPSGLSHATAPASGLLARETAVHEAIHQLAFNAGLHSRMSPNPVWVVEGIATQFERGSQGLVKTSASERINPARLATFDDYRRNRRKAGALAELIASDDVFGKAPLDAYGEAWLLTHYLIEARGQKFAWYLKTLAARHPMDRYPADERLADFQNAFGKDLAWFEVEMLRYAEKLAADMRP